MRRNDIDNSAAEADILIDGELTDRVAVFFKIFCQSGTADYLQLVKFDDVDGQRRSAGDGLENHVVSLARQSEDKVQSDGDACAGRARDGIDSVAPMMAAVYEVESGVVRRFGTVFHNDEMLIGQKPKVGEERVGHTVGSSADNYSVNEGVGESLLIDGPQTVKLAVSVGVGLKVSQISHLGVFAAEEAYAFVDLLRHRHFGRAKRGVESFVVAIRATATAFSAVAVRARESGVDGDFLQFLSGEPFGEEVGKIAVEISHGRIGKKDFGDKRRKSR